MPIWAWYLKQFLAGFGWPLFLSLVAGLGAGAIVAVRDRIVPARALLLTVGIAVYLGVFSTWEYVRVHHLLPTFPMLLVLFSIAVERIKNTRWKQVALGVLVVSTGIYAGTGLVGYATEPRDQATEWLATNANDDETVEVYENSIADVAVPHRQRLSRYDFPEENATYNSSLVLDESNYTEWMVNVSERRPEYIQLTPAEFDYVTPGHPDYERYPNRREFISGLVSGKHDYTVVATFGRQSDDQSITEKVLTSGIVPDIEGQTEYIMLLERNT